jgi:hypothetical protein
MRWLPAVPSGPRRRPLFRPCLERLEDRTVPSVYSDIANAMTHGTEYYSHVVTNAYTTYLDRNPTSAEVSAWVAVMQSRLVTDERLEAGFIGSPEYIANHGGPGAGWVTGMYKDLLGRTPTQDEVNAWVAALAGGELPTQVAYGFAASTEREGQRVTKDYTTYVGRSPTPAEVSAWVQAFQNGTDNETVIAGFVGSTEYFNKHYGQAANWIEHAYLDILQRPPDTPAFTTLLTALGGNVTAGIPSSGVYGVSIQGNVDGNTFSRSDGVLLLTPTVTAAGTTNGVNSLDFLLGFGNPSTNPQTGSLWFATNSALFAAFGGTTSASALDFVFENINPTTATVTAQVDSSVAPASTFFNSFNATSSATANLYEVSGGAVGMQFQNGGQSLVGSINLTGTGYLFSGNSHYQATITASLL